MRRVAWSRSALDDFVGAVSFIAAQDPGAASALAESMDEAARGLGWQPTGRPGRISGTYEKLVPRTRYIMAYALADEAVTILRVIHTARNWTREGWPDEEP